MLRNYLLLFLTASTVAQNLLLTRPTQVNGGIRQAENNNASVGVMARLNFPGVHYVTYVVGNALTSQLSLERQDPDAKSFILKSLPTISLSDVRVTKFVMPVNFHLDFQPPISIKVHLISTNVSINSVASGRIDDFLVNDNGLKIRTSKLQLDLKIDIRRNSVGNPALTINTCRIPPNIPVTIAVAKTMTPSSGTKLANAIAASGHEIFEEVICTKIRHIIHSRINRRFELLPSKIILGEASKYDVVEKLIQAEEKLRQLRMMRNLVKREIRRPELKLVTLNGTRVQATAKITVHDNRLSHDVDIKRQTKQVSGQVHGRIKRQRKMHSFLRNFDWKRVNSLILDFGMIREPRVTQDGIEVATSGQVTSSRATTPFSATPISLPADNNSDSMLMMIVSDFVPNTLMYHGHSVGLFNTRIEPRTPQLGAMMRTTCDLSTGSLFCLGDIFPTLREIFPNRYLLLEFQTLQAPSLLVRSEDQGGIQFNLVGLITLTGLNSSTVLGNERPLGSMEIHLKANMNMRLASKSVKGKVTLEDIKLITRSPNILIQEELDDAGFLSREILQRMVNDILKQGIPIPVHPLFKLVKPKLILSNRAMIFATDFDLNEQIIQQLTAETLRRSA